MKMKTYLTIGLAFSMLRMAKTLVTEENRQNIRRKVEPRIKEAGMSTDLIMAIGYSLGFVFWIIAWPLGLLMKVIDG